MDVMIDLETLGNGSDAAIIAIGAVEFSLHSRAMGNTIYLLVDPQSSIDTGGKVEGSTVCWWMMQSDLARHVFNPAVFKLHISSALYQFSDWMSRRGASPNVWGNGAVFDNVVLSNAYKRVGLQVPWTYKQDRCFRTIKAQLPKIEVPTEGTVHNALDDAKWQASYLIELSKKYPILKGE